MQEWKPIGAQSTPPAKPKTLPGKLTVTSFVPVVMEGAERISKGDEGYGSPVRGSKTWERAQTAHRHVVEEISLLCHVIETHGQQDPNGQTLILFGDLFEVYSSISETVVGMLLRARKHQLLYFEGETLFQRKDDHVPILLFYPAEVCREKLIASGLQSGTVHT